MPMSPLRSQVTMLKKALIWQSTISMWNGIFWEVQLRGMSKYMPAVQNHIQVSWNAQKKSVRQILYISDIFFYLKIRRKPLFYIVNLIIPCVGIFYLSILVFYLPAQSGEKTALAIAILVSQTLYFTLVIEVIPATSLTLPLLGRYLLFSMVLVAVSVCLATIVLNLHYRKPSTHRMPTWVRNVLIQKMPGILLMRVPKQVDYQLETWKGVVLLFVS